MTAPEINDNGSTSRPSDQSSPTMQRVDYRGVCSCRAIFPWRWPASGSSSPRTHAYARQTGFIQVLLCCVTGSSARFDTRGRQWPMSGVAWATLAIKRGFGNTSWRGIEGSAGPSRPFPAPVRFGGRRSYRRRKIAVQHRPIAAGFPWLGNPRAFHASVAGAFSSLSNGNYAVQWPVRLRPRVRAWCVPLYSGCRSQGTLLIPAQLAALSAAAH